MKKEVKLEYGTALHYVGRRNELINEEFWGANHANLAIQRYNDLCVERTMYWHNFVPVQKNG